MPTICRSVRLPAPRSGLSRRLSGVGLCACLWGTAAAAAEPTRLKDITTAQGLTAPVSRTPAVDSEREASPFLVRSAAWLDEVDGTAAADIEDSMSRPHVTPVSGDSAQSEGPAALPLLDSAATPGVKVSSEPGDAAAERPPEPLSRLQLPDMSSRIDPEQTLRDWAEGAGLLVGFGIVALWLVRQWIARSTQPGGPTAHLRTVESLSLPQRCRIHLVEVQGRHVLVAQDAAGVKSVTLLPDRFAELLDRAAPEGAPETTTAEPPTAAAERLRDWSALRETRLT